MMLPTLKLATLSEARLPGCLLGPHEQGHSRCWGSLAAWQHKFASFLAMGCCVDTRAGHWFRFVKASWCVILESRLHEAAFEACADSKGVYISHPHARSKNKQPSPPVGL